MNDSDNGFSEWFHELQGFTYRSEHLQNDIKSCRMQQEYLYTWITMKKWIEAAYQSGYKRGKG